MKKRLTVRALIIKNDKILTMYRRNNKNNVIKEFYTLPGGGVDEEDHSLIIALKRELKEELNIEVINIMPYSFFEDENNITLIFTCNYFSGNIEIIGEEKDRNNSNNFYEPRLLGVEELNSNIDFWYKKDALELIIQ